MIVQEAELITEIVVLAQFSVTAASAAHGRRGDKWSWDLVKCNEVHSVYISACIQHVYN